MDYMEIGGMESICRHLQRIDTKAQIARLNSMKLNYLRCRATTNGMNHRFFVFPFIPHILMNSGRKSGSFVKDETNDQLARPNLISTA